jgi:hypothetical protein
MATFDANKFKRDLQAAQRRAQAEMKRQVDAVNRKNQQSVDAYNRQARAANQKTVADHNQRVAAHNREIQRVNAHNANVVGGLNRQLRSQAAVRSTYTPNEQALVDRVHDALVSQDKREWDVFLSYARIDGEIIATALRDALESCGVRVWFDSLVIVPGKSQSLQMDQGLRKAGAGVVLLTPAYLVGRFWTERELGALLNKSTLIPVLHQSTFTEVAEYSGILPDLGGFETARDSIQMIAEKIAAAVMPSKSVSSDND